MLRNTIRTAPRQPRPSRLGIAGGGKAVGIAHLRRVGVGVGQGGERQVSRDRAVELGAAIVLEPFDLPGGPTMAGITDPEGNPVMLVQQ